LTFKLNCAILYGSIETYGVNDDKANRDLTTSIRYPWCLVYRGGQCDGGRSKPFTRMAYLKSAVPGTNGESYMGYLLNENLGGWTKTLRRIEHADIAYRFNGWHAPVLERIKKVKKKLPRSRN
jgi:hypothetical protein